MIRISGKGQHDHMESFESGGKYEQLTKLSIVYCQLGEDKKRAHPSFPQKQGGPPNVPMSRQKTSQNGLWSIWERRDMGNSPISHAKAVDTFCFLCALRNQHIVTVAQMI